MSFVDTIMTKRGPGRPRKEVERANELFAALGAPVPAGIEDAIKKVEAAVAAFEMASSAYQEAAAFALPQLLQAAVDKAERDLTDAVVQREVADRIGGDGPSDEDLAGLEKAITVARANLSSSETRKEAYRTATEDRRESLSQAQQEMWAVVDEWVRRAMTAADRQIAEGVKLIAEAQSAAKKLDTWQRREFPPLRHPSVISGGDWHRGGDGEVTVPADILRAIATWRRADRAINRL